MNETQHILLQLGVALAIGLLIGTERGWKERDAQEGERIAGVRTFGLLGLLGGGSALLVEHIGPLAVGLGFLALAGILTTVYVVNLDRGRERVGITSLVAALLTFVFGALAAAGEITVAAASAVVTTLLLSYKPQLHHWVSVLQAQELRAGIKLLLISVVLLPILPNQGFGPWQALNPFEIWWLVVLIAVISFIGYFTVKIWGIRRGTVFTGLLGGLASSTALTLHYSRLVRDKTKLTPILAVGALLASGTMLPRLLLVVAVLNPALIQPLLIPTLVMALLIYLPAALFWRTHHNATGNIESPLKNPLALHTAITFGLLLALVLVLGEALQQWFGDLGVLGLAAVSGIANIDAISLSLARMSQDDLLLRIAVLGIVIAAAMNNLAKGAIAYSIGGRGFGLRVGLPLLASALGGIASAWWLAR